MIGYVVLHYLNAEVTRKCVDSLLRITKDSDSIISIVDNGSENDSYKTLYDYYLENKKIKLIKLKKNLGYARGNNAGYLYLKNNFTVDYIIICNNDLLFEQKDFEKQIKEEYHRNMFDVAGPDITDLDGNHLNPHRLRILKLQDIRRLNAKKSVMLGILKLKTKLPFIEKVNIIEKHYFKTKNTDYFSRYEPGLHTDIVLQGSCIVFGERYIKREDEAFLPDTFLYFEEDLLALKCKVKSYRTVVLKNVQVKHLEGKSTEGISANHLQRNIFMISNMLHSGKIYEKEVRRLMTVKKGNEEWFS